MLPELRPTEQWHHQQWLWCLRGPVGADASGVPCQLLASGHDNALKQINESLHSCSIDRVLSDYHNVSPSDITCPPYFLPTLLIVDPFHRRKQASHEWLERFLLLSQLSLSKSVEEPTLWGTKWCHISHGIIFQLVKKLPSPAKIKSISFSIHFYIMS